MTRISESQLILPSLLMMSLSKSKKLTTSDLIPMLRELLKPEGEDLEILAGRNDDKFSQKVRNLKAHNTFERYGYAEYKKGSVTITPKGENYLKENFHKLEYLLSNNFAWDDLKYGLEKIQVPPNGNDEVEVFEEIIDVAEGRQKFVKTKIYERSSKLRQFAINHYSQDGDIFCRACNFSFYKFYGEVGRGYIEIHHIKPVFKYQNQDLIKSLEQALQNVVPICSNCHRIIHKNQNNMLPITALVSSIKQHGKFDIKK